MIRIVIAFVAVFLLWQVWRRLTQQGDLASRERWRKGGLYALGGALLALGVWFAATGRLHAAWIGLLGLFAWLRRGMLFYNLFRNLRSGTGHMNEGFRSRFGSFFRHAQNGRQSGRQGGRQGEGRARRGGTITRRQAARLLEVAEGASKEEITHAYRRKMRAAHPDVGGDAKLASRLNAARDVLLDG